MKEKNTSNKIDWNNNFKIRIRRNASFKHEIIKLAIVRNILEKYKRNLYWIRVYTEHELVNENGETKITDVYFENIKNNEIICYEIQKNTGKKWIEDTEKFYRDLTKLYFNIDWITIKEKDFSDDINMMNKEVELQIV